MSYRKKLGKDTVIFATKEDHATPSTVKLPEPDPQPGLLLEDGSINWNCPCLGGMATGPCGVPFREAFSCFQNSKEEPKGSECYEAFMGMQTCMQKYPKIYGPVPAPPGGENDLMEMAGGSEADTAAKDTNKSDLTPSAN
ncbi:hypothetical protein AAG570_009897 [Ranatra chinensis]|uniref:CHCH domain-containing protein n=1 Tax=Ranatra chinensis TaxID=642074 RepID=A0ABD0YQI2_9HEMI